MKKLTILCEYSSYGPHFVRSGWKHVFEALGHRFVWWNPQRKSAFDAFSENDPVDIFLGTTYGVDRAVHKNIVKRPEMKVALFASAWGPWVKDVDLKKYPIVVVSEAEKRIISSLRETCQKPNYVFIHAHDKWLEGTMSGWGEIGVPYRGILNAADTYVYLNGHFRPELACDVGYVGGLWPYKGRNIQDFLFPLCHPSAGLRVKIFGNFVWPLAQYLGTCSDQEARDLFVSARVCPNVSEPHSTDLGFDCVERLYKVAAAGGFLVSDFVEEARDLFSESELPMARSASEFKDMIHHFVKHPEEREPYRVAMRKKVLTEHTYFERVFDMFEGFGMHGEASRVLALKGEALKGVL